MKTHNRLFQLLIILLPSQLAFHLWPDWALIFGIRVDYLSPTIFLTDLIIGALIFFWLVEDKPQLPVNRKKNRQRLYLLFCLVILNCVFSLSPLVSIFRWIKLAEMGVLFWYVCSTKKLSDVVPWLTIAVLWTNLLAALQVINTGSLNGFWYWLGERHFTSNTPGIALQTVLGAESVRPYATFPHPNALAGFLGVSILLFSHLARSLFQRMALFFTGITFFLTRSESALIALAVSVIFLVIRKAPLSGSILKLGLLALVLSSVLLLLISPYLVSTPVPLPREISERILLLARSAETLAQLPFSGVGLGAFIIVAPRTLLQPVHNIFVLYVVELGVAGLIYIFFEFLRDNSRRLVSPLFVGVFIFIGLTGFLDHYWATLQQPLILATIVVGLSMSEGSKHNPLS